jgi:hypothetical protein
LVFVRTTVLCEVCAAAKKKTVLIFVIKTDFVIGEMLAEAEAVVEHRA